MSRLFLGAALASLATASYMPSELVERQTTCATGLHLMIAGGCHLPCVSNEPGLLSSLIGDIVGAFPGSDQYFVPYDNSTQQGAVSTPLMIKAVESYITTCPNTPIVLLGYSLGGIITTNTICAIPFTKNILASITYGQETYTYPESYDVGTCTQNAPKFPRANTASCEKFAPALQQYCDAADAACCTGGTSQAAHFEYAQFYDQKALAFVKSRYALLPVTSTSSTSSSTSTSSSSSSSSTSVSATTTATGSTTSVTSTSVAPVVPLSTGSGEPFPTVAPGVYSNTTTVVPVIGTATGSSVVVFMTSAIPVSEIEGVGSATATTTIVVAGQTYTVTEGSAPTGTEGISVSLVTTTIPIYATSYSTVTPVAHSPSSPSGTLAPYNPSSTLTPFAGGAAELPVLGFGSFAIAALAAIVLL